MNTTRPTYPIDMHATQRVCANCMHAAHPTCAIGINAFRQACTTGINTIRQARAIGMNAIRQTCAISAHVARPTCIMKRNLYNDDGFSTVSMVIALILTLSLIFSSAQVYRINTQSASTQEIADACALAAENQVAEFYTVARVCDAALLSMSLTASVVGALGVAALCTPVSAPLSADLITASKNLFSTRNTVAETAAENLNRWQTVLPYLAIAASAACAQANSTSSHTYLGIAILCPTQGELIKFDSDIPIQIIESVENESDTVTEEFSNAEDVVGRANSAKHEAWLHDCGHSALGTGLSQYERATSLASLRGTLNPMVRTEASWNFQKAITRSRAYYNARITRETPLDSSVNEQTNSALRKAFYTYAYNELLNAYALEDAGEFDCYFPLLPCTLDELRKTSLYDEDIFCVSMQSGKQCAHAYSGCPGAQNITGYASAHDIENGDFATCPSCHVSPLDLALVASATTHVDTGYEYHYRIIANAANEYRSALKGEAGEISQTKNTIINWLNQIKDFMISIMNKRIDPTPPGKSGTIALVIDLESSEDFSSNNAFMTYEGTVGTRIALSGATLAEEQADASHSVVADILSGLADSDNAVVGVSSIVLKLWNGMLFSYSQGQQSLTNLAKDVFNDLPWQSAVGLGSWISSQFTKAIESIGLQPAQLNTPRAILANTSSVASKEAGDEFCAQFLRIKTAALATSGNTQALQTLLSEQKDLLLQSAGLEEITLTIAVIKPLGSNGPRFPITISLPLAQLSSGLTESLSNALSYAISSLRSYAQQLETGESTWK